MSDDLSAFLTARLDEDQAQAQDAISERGRIAYDPPLPDGFEDFGLQAWADVNVPAVLLGPERVLAEIEAKRNTLAIHQRNTENGGDLDPDCTKCMSWETGVDPYDELVTDAEYDSWPCDTVKALASVYANHPDYRPEWFVSIRGGASRISS